MPMEKQYTYRIIDYYDLGLIDYREAWDIQKDFYFRRVKNEIADSLFLLEHNHTYTLGKITDKNNLIGSDDYLKSNNISVYEIDRGGDITYHGPGQIVGYPIINLEEWKKDTHLYLRALEDVIISTCNDFGLPASRKDKLTGVWIENRKICAIGIKVSRWVTMHGFAFNVNTDLSLFQGIIPCGIKDKEVTSLQKELDRNFSISDVKQRLLQNFIRVFGYSGYSEKSLNQIDSKILN